MSGRELLCVQVQRIRLGNSYLPISKYTKEIEGQTDFQDAGKKAKRSISVLT